VIAEEGSTVLFRQLEYFVALARERHFARAAAACYVSQPALSEAIRKLEHELDVALVIRGHAFEGLTPEGERLVRWAQRILADHDSLKQEVAALRSGLAGRLRLGVVPSATTAAARVVAPFCAQHPLARVTVSGALRSAEIVRRLHAFELDAGILYPDVVDGPDLETHVLYSEEHVLVADRELAGDLPESATWTQVAHLPLCLLEGGMRGRQLLDEALLERGLKLEPQVETDSVASVLSHAATGHWAGVVPLPWLSALPPSSLSLRVIRLRDPVLRAPVALVTPAGSPVPLLARAFTDTAVAVPWDAGFEDTV
jgi:DNA-binding transcriptional LysR family regulator